MSLICVLPATALGKTLVISSLNYQNKPVSLNQTPYLLMHSSPQYGQRDLSLLLSQYPSSTISDSVPSMSTHLGNLAGHVTPFQSASSLGLFSNLTQFYFLYYLPDTEPGPVIIGPCSNGIYIPVCITKVENGNWESSECFKEVTEEMRT